MSDVDIMERPGLWPHLLLPLKREYEIAVLYPAPDNDGIFKVEVGMSLFGPLREDRKIVEYATAQAVVDAGWKID